MMRKRFFTIPQVAQLLGVSEKTIRRWIAAKGIRPAAFPSHHGGKGGPQFLTAKHIEALKA